MHEINKFVLPLLAIIVLVLPGGGFGARSQKPLSPVQVTIEPVQSGLAPADIGPGDVVALKVTAISFMDVEEMRLEMGLLGGAKLVSGQTSWKGAAAGGEEKAILLTVQAPEKGKGRVRARVSIPSPKGTRFSAEAWYVLGPEAKAEPEQEGQVKKDGKGESIIEYR